MSMCCLTGAPCFVDPCAKCPDRGADFKTWLETYKPGTAFDHGDMAACWHAAQRSYRATFARPEALRIGATPRTNAVLSEVSSFFDPYRIVDTKLRDLSFRLEIELAQAKADLAEVDEANTRLARDRQTTPSPHWRSHECSTALECQRPFLSANENRR